MIDSATSPAAETDALQCALTERLAQLQRVQAPTEHSSLLEALQAEDFRTHAIAWIEFHKFAKGIDELLHQDDRLPRDTPMFIRTDNDAINFTHNLGATLLWEAAKRGSAQAGIDWALKVLRTKDARGQTISPVWGITIESLLELSGGMRLVPLSLVLPSRSCNGCIPSKLH